MDPVSDRSLLLTIHRWATCSSRSRSAAHRVPLASRARARRRTSLPSIIYSNSSINNSSKCHTWVPQRSTAPSVLKLTA